MVPRAALPGFWIFMYRVSPFTYTVDSMLSTAIAQHEVRCSPLELIQFQPPNGQTCGEYMTAFPVGQVYNPTAISDCKFCSLTNTDEFLASVDIFYSQRWRGLGLLWAYILFNVLATFFVYWVARLPKSTK
jgi:ATP-binding cassette, subfamily G (WHITE), member 2, PDR